MKNSFDVLKQNIATRRFGGTNAGVADPYVTGYHYIRFASLPTSLVNYTNMRSNITDLNNIQSILSAACLSVTPPGGTLNRVEFTGLGGIKWAVPGNIDYGNTVTCKFLEMNGTPILDIMHGWVKMIRDYSTGVSHLAEGDNLEGYSKKSYSSQLYYWTTAPDGVTIEYYACYDGVFPTKDPQDLFTSDVETVGRLDVEIEFNVDYAWHEPWVFNKCANFAGEFADAINTVSQYNAS